MISQNVLIEIDKAIKKIWLNEIVSDYDEGLLLKEDSLKCSLYHHMRNKLDYILKENNLRIYPEFYFKSLKYRADIAIVEIEENCDKEYLADMIKNIIAIIELKYDYGSDEQTISMIKKDVWKIKDYIQNGKMLCQ